jgi:hypothetical protein
MSEHYDKSKSVEVNQVEALFAIAEALRSVAYQIRDLGTAGAATPLGAIEFLAVQVKDGLSSVSEAIREHDSAPGRDYESDNA